MHEVNGNQGSKKTKASSQDCFQFSPFRLRRDEIIRRNGPRENTLQFTHKYLKDPFIEIYNLNQLVEVVSFVPDNLLLVH